MITAIRGSLSPRFVPDLFIAAPGIPRTLSGKKQELPIKRLFQGWPVARVVDPNLIEGAEVIPWYVDQAQQWRAVARRQPQNEGAKSDDQPGADAEIAR